MTLIWRKWPDNGGRNVKALLHIIGWCLVGYTAVALTVVMVIVAVLFVVAWPIYWVLTPGYRASKMLW